MHRVLIVVEKFLRTEKSGDKKKLEKWRTSLGKKRQFVKENDAGKGEVTGEDRRGSTTCKREDIHREKNYYW